MMGIRGAGVLIPHTQGIRRGLIHPARRGRVAYCDGTALRDFGEQPCINLNI